MARVVETYSNAPEEGKERVGPRRARHVGVAKDGACVLVLKTSNAPTSERVTLYDEAESPRGGARIVGEKEAVDVAEGRARDADANET